MTTIAIENKNETRRGIQDTFPADGFTEVDYRHNKVLFSIGAKLLKKCVDKVIFATDPKDFADRLGNVAISVSENKISFMGTDGRRCALYSLSAGDKDVAIKANNQKILIDAKLLKKCCRSFDSDETIEAIDCEDGEHVILGADNTKVRLRVASEIAKQEFPSVINILSLAWPTTIVADKTSLSKAIEFLRLYNPEKSIFYVKEGKSEIKIDAARRGTDPETALAKCEPIKASLANPVAMSNKFIVDCCKKIIGSVVKISFTKDERKIRMESTTDKHFVYFMQAMTAK